MQKCSMFLKIDCLSQWEALNCTSSEIPLWCVCVCVCFYLIIYLSSVVTMEHQQNFPFPDTLSANIHQKTPRPFRFLCSVWAYMCYQELMSQ